jgi:hypothetical protein
MPFIRVIGDRQRNLLTKKASHINIIILKNTSNLVIIHSLARSIKPLIIRKSTNFMSAQEKINRHSDYSTSFNQWGEQMQKPCKERGLAFLNLTIHNYNKFKI